jgi:glutamate dehydrogenase
MRDSRILECYANYIHQVYLHEKAPTGPQNPLNQGPAYRLRSAWTRNPHLAAWVVARFKDKFSLDQPQHPDNSTALPSTVDASDLEDVQPMIQAIEKTVRTNFYNPDAGALAIKIIHDTGIIEIFMDHDDFQGVLLKGAMMARGGLRLSDRSDFRTECWQLMETQVLKNTIIVPSGAKGAFLRKGADQSPLACYALFVEGLLDLSDNLDQGRVVAPAHVRCYDGHDFYNVVAADKGTATFSDHGNGIALRRGYWLGDAFASGGSNGYSHKKLAITSRGTWVSVRHHLAQLGHKGDRPLRVIGVGDMAGDIFGNGMLEESNMHLLAAFNHEAIFIDPTPNPDASYRERCRLFHLQGSKWSDYAAFSLGGAVYDRSQETIELSPQACALLGLDQANVSPDELIRRILSMSVDLLWLGGIGTFIQGENEGVISDVANQQVRIFGKQVRAKIVAEGANLGMTQEGRIEYALNGGILNTDAIDNCAGVNCSDHEINIKILLDQVVHLGGISDQERNHILESITQDVCASVLRENAWQNLIVTHLCHEGTSIDDALAFLAIYKNAKGGHDPVLEQLKQSLLDGKTQGRAITRPEMAVILSYGKQRLKRVLTALDVSHWGNEEVARYFPRAIQERFSGFLKDHLLFDAIKTSMLTNRFIDVLGPLQLDMWAQSLGMAFEDLVMGVIQLDCHLHGHRLAKKIEGMMGDLPVAMGLMKLYRAVLDAGLAHWARHTSNAGSGHIQWDIPDQDLHQKYQSMLAVVTTASMNLDGNG